MNRLLTLIIFSIVIGKIHSQILVCSTIHRSHEENPYYTYNDLLEFINAYDADIIAVEIRDMDMASTEDYLRKNYPWEMYMVKSLYRGKKVLGYDWLGEELEGRSIPSNYWSEESDIKWLERQFAQDTNFHEKMTHVDSLQKIKLELFLHENLEGLNDGRYDKVNLDYYEALEEKLKGTIYQPLTDFYKRRNDLISKNILKIINANPTKKILVLTGADHRGFINKALKAEGVEVQEKIREWTDQNKGNSTLKKTH